MSDIGTDEAPCRFLLQRPARTVTDRNVTRRNTPTATLTPLQRTILELVSSAGPLSAEQVRERLHPAHQLKDSTVRTLLRRLEARGLLSHTVDGKSFLYRAEVAPTRVAARTVQRLIDSFWSGSAERFLAGLVDEKVLSPKDLERLAKKIRSHR